MLSYAGCWGGPVIILSCAVQGVVEYLLLCYYVQGVGEDLAAAGVGDDSVDAVVMTLVLCTVQDQIQTLQVLSILLY